MASEIVLEDQVTIPNIKLHEAALQYEISILEQEMSALDPNDLDGRIQIWANLVMYRSKLLALHKSAPRIEDIISPRRLKAFQRSVNSRSS